MSITKYDAIPEPLKKYAPVVFVVNILSHKWTLFILLSLKEPMRFNQLRRHLNISHTVLSQELKHLETMQLLNRYVIEETNPPAVEYSLTNYGQQLLNICMEMQGIGRELDEIVSKNI